MQSILRDSSQRRRALAAAAAGAMILGLIFAIRPWDASGAAVQPLPLKYGVQTRAQTPAEAATKIDPRTSPWTFVQGSIRVSQATAAGNVVLARSTEGETCIRFEAAAGGVYEACGDPAKTVNEDLPGVIAMTVGGTAAGGKEYYVGVVPDGVAGVAVNNGTPIAVQGNAFVVPVTPRVASEITLSLQDGSAWTQFKLDLSEQPSK